MEEKLRACKDTITLLAQLVLSVAMLVGFFWLLIAMFGEIRSGNDSLKEVFIGIVGTLTGCVVTIFAWWFGTSRGSAAKTEATNAQIAKLSAG